MRGHVVVIDPAMRSPELASLNRMALASPWPLTYHLPALFGMSSLAQEAMHLAKGLVILGSAASVNDRLEWQTTFEAWLKPHLDRGLPTLGICYGHQLLAYLYGGQVGYVFPDQKKHVGLRQVTVETTPWWSKATGPIGVSHNEQVQQVPSCMKVIASSAEISVDGLAHKTLPIWSFQSHPEATAVFFHDRGIDLGETKLGFGHELVDRFLTHLS